MDKSIQRGLNDRFYDKRKAAALELERQIRQLILQHDTEKIHRIIDELCRNYAYAVHQPNARNGGLIGLAAAAIALGQNEVAPYLEDIIHPVLACFGDQDARVRYYACEAMYNIAKVAKGEILVYFNEIFDVLCKLAADSDISVKNGADLLDRLMKDIVAEKAATYVSTVHNVRDAHDASLLQTTMVDHAGKVVMVNAPHSNTAFSLPRFIPLLTERIYAINPFTRMFLVSWINLLDSIPNLELISYLPAFLGGLISFLSDSHKDVRVVTHSTLDVLLHEIKRVAEFQRAVKLHRKRQLEAAKRDQTETGGRTETEAEGGADTEAETETETEAEAQNGSGHGRTDSESAAPLAQSSDVESSLTDGNPPFMDTFEINDEEEYDKSHLEDEGLYMPGEDVHIDYPKTIEILISHLDSSEEEIQLVVLSWLDAILEIAPYALLPHVPKLLSILLQNISYDDETLREKAVQVNSNIMAFIESLPSDEEANSVSETKTTDTSDTPAASEARMDVSAPRIVGLDPETEVEEKLDYGATINTLTLHFLNDHETTRSAALDWLIMLHHKVPKQFLLLHDKIFITLLKALSDPSETVVNRDLQLLSQISYESDDGYFSLFMSNLLELFKTDRRLLESKGYLIIKQLCISLDPQRIYRILAELLEKEEDTEFASVMVQILNNNLTTAPELGKLRKMLRDPSDAEGSQMYVILFRCWCHSAPATLSLCLLAQAYKHAYAVLEIFTEFEITVSLLVQIDILVQLLESPVFTRLRMQLLEPEKYPFLHKCLYGILMLLPQSSAFTTLSNRLTSVAPMGVFPRDSVPAKSAAASADSVDPARTEEWPELLEKFRAVQQRHEEMRNAKAETHRSVLTEVMPKMSSKRGSYINQSGGGSVRAFGPGMSPMSGKARLQK